MYCIYKVKSIIILLVVARILFTNNKINKMGSIYKIKPVKEHVKIVKKMLFINGCRYFFTINKISYIYKNS